MAVTITVDRPHQCGHRRRRHAGLACLHLAPDGLHVCEVETAHDMHLARDAHGRIVAAWESEDTP